ncbi:MAG: LPS export ABC transporter permease LptG [bacterium]
MRILDWYIIRRFCLTLGYALVAAILIFIFVNMVGHLPKFIDKNVPSSVIAQYYLFFIPQIFILALPIAMLLSSLFSLGYMSRYNELTAIKSAGVSIYRTLLPLFLVSFMISGFALGFGESVLPVANQNKRNIERKYLDPFSRSNRLIDTNIFLRDNKDRRIFIGEINHKSNNARRVTIQKYSQNQIVERIDAPRMFWQDSTWVLFYGYRRSFTNQSEIATSFDSLKGELDIKPEKFAYFKVEPEDMSFQELQDFISEILRNGGDPDRWLVDLHFKISLPFANLIMVLFGAPLASQKKRSGAVFGFIVSLLICFIYYGSNKFIQTLGQNGTLDPLFAAWITNGVFLTAGCVLIVFLRK